MFADLIDGPLAHLPSGHFGANSAWALCAAIAHNLLHAAGTLAGRPHARARGATLRRQLITVPARLARPARTPVLHLPSRWPWAPRMAAAVGPAPSATAHPPLPDTHPAGNPARAPRSVEELDRPIVEPHHRAQPTSRRLTPTPPTHRPEHSIPWKSWTDQRLRRASAPPDMITWKSRSPPQLFRGSRLRPRAAHRPAHLPPRSPCLAPLTGSSFDLSFW